MNHFIDFLLFMGTIILMPIILMGAYHCILCTHSAHAGARGTARAASTTHSTAGSTFFCCAQVFHVATLFLYKSNVSLARPGEGSSPAATIVRNSFLFVLFLTPRLSARSSLPLCLFWPVFVPFLACLCAFSGLSLCLFWPVFVPFLACLCAVPCAFSCLPLRHFLPAFAPFLAWLAFAPFFALPWRLFLPAFICLHLFKPFLACLFAFACLPFHLFLPTFSGLPSLRLFLPAFPPFISCLPFRLFLPAFPPFLACLLFAPPFLACFCAFSCLSAFLCLLLSLFLSSFAPPFLACLCAVPCLPLCCVLPAVVPLHAYLCAFSRLPLCCVLPPCLRAFS
jgi:hypothetical protein